MGDETHRSHGAPWAQLPGSAVMCKLRLSAEAALPPEQCRIRSQALWRSGWVAWPALWAQFLQLLKTTQTKGGKAARPGTQRAKDSAHALANCAQGDAAWAALLRGEDLSSPSPLRVCPCFGQLLGGAADASLSYSLRFK